MRRIMWSVVLAGAAVVAGGGLLAQSARAQSMQFEEEVIVGDVLKPEITVFISRENLTRTYDIEFEESFLDRIVESVERAPF